MTCDRFAEVSLIGRGRRLRKMIAGSGARRHDGYRRIHSFHPSRFSLPMRTRRFLTLAAMGDETRQHIILEMMRMDYNGSRVPDITARTNLSRPAVSHHLQILKDAGIVKMRREGTMTFYYLDPDMASFHRLSEALNQAVAICAELPDRSGEVE